MLLDDPLDELHGAVDTVSSRVDAQVIVVGGTPLAAGIELVVVAVLLIQLFQQLCGLLMAQLITGPLGLESTLLCRFRALPCPGMRLGRGDTY